MRVDEHTEDTVVDEIGDLLAGGRLVALVTDAGMPGISDPGETLVRAAVGAGHEVSVVPGPSAVVSALAVSGLSTARFAFEGFLPRKGSQRSERLAELATERRTLVLFESPHRLSATLAELGASLGGDRPAAVVRELTKLHEEVARGRLDELIGWAEGPVKGEVVIVVEGAPAAAEATDDEIIAAVRSAMATGSSRRDASAEVAAMLGVGRRRVYELALADAGGAKPSED